MITLQFHISIAVKNPATLHTVLRFLQRILITTAAVKTWTLAWMNFCVERHSFFAFCCCCCCSICLCAVIVVCERKAIRKAPAWCKRKRFSLDLKRTLFGVYWGVKQFTHHTHNSNDEKQKPTDFLDKFNRNLLEWKRTLDHALYYSTVRFC